MSSRLVSSMLVVVFFFFFKQKTAYEISPPHGDRLPVHGIVLLSEMYAFIDWREIGRQVVALSNNEDDMALFHVVDLLELSDVARQSDSAAMFNNFLVQRWLGVRMKGTAYGRIA